MGWSRFEVVRRVGAGGMGVVYEARDRTTGERVAIKTLQEHDATALYRLKKEFRGLQNIVHRNLIQFRELVEEAGEWFLVMELVEGCDALQYVRSTCQPLELELATTDAAVGSTLPVEASVSFTPPRDYDRVRSVVTQIASALDHLHASGRVHCDIKPSNVLVDGTGRAIVLDLGLARVTRGPVSSTDGLAGTVPYISPEQVMGHSPAAASDCYALGVVLFELLTGCWPFRGSAVQILSAKCSSDPPALAELSPTIPRELSELCASLLHRDPTLRPTARDVLRVLAATEPLPQAIYVERSAFFGRGPELARLHAALDRVRGGDTQLVWVRGASGVGKTSLVKHFLDEVNGADVLALTARCHERETVPFKAVDGIIDALTSFLRSREEAEVASFLPRHVTELCAAFPVLGRVPSIQRVADESRVRDRGGDRRERAFTALREMLTRLGERRIVVLFIDDLQWGDADSMLLLREVLRPPDAPPVLVVLTSRDDAAVESLVARLDADPAAFVRVDVDVLDPDCAERFANHLIEQTGLKNIGLGASIGTEANGHPLHIQELVQHAANAGSAATAVRLDDALGARIDRLPDHQRELLRLACLAGAPITTAILQLASAAPAGQMVADITLLTAANLLKSSSGSVSAIEPYHDRVRELVTSRLAVDERRELHRRLASALESNDSGVPAELLMAHCMGCDMVKRAATYAARAAREAEDRLACNRAAELYEFALTHGQYDRPTRTAITARHAFMLSAAGRPLAAGHAFRAAAQLADDVELVDLERRGLEHLLIAGEVEEASLAIQRLTHLVGARIPLEQRTSIAKLLVQRVRLKLRGLKFTERRESELERGVRQRLDVLYALSSGMAFINPIAIRTVQARFLREALDAGEPRRIVLAYAFEVGFVGMQGPKGSHRVARAHARATELARKLGDPVVMAVIELAGGMCSYYAGNFRRALESFDRAVPLLRENTEMQWVDGMRQTYRLTVLWCLGRYRDLMAEQAQSLKAAEEQGNVYNQRTLLSWRGNHAWLVRDDPRGARAAVSSVARARPPNAPAQLAEYYELLSNTLIDLYELDGETAFARVEGAWPKIRQLMRVHTVAIEYTYLLGCAAISIAHKQSRAIKIAGACVRKLQRLDTRYSRMLATQLRAAITARQGDRITAIALLRVVISECEELDARGQQMAARLRLAMLDDGPQSQADAADVEAKLRAQGVVVPRRFANMFTPGLVDG